MNIRFLLIGLFLLFTASSTFAQTADELDAKFGLPFKAYLIRPTVMMTVKYAENGQVSEMIVSKRIEDNSNPTIAPVIVREIVEELVPVARRGAKITLSRPLPLGFGSSYAFEDYENVSISYEITNLKDAPQCSGTLAIIIKWKNVSEAANKL